MVRVLKDPGLGEVSYTAFRSQQDDFSKRDQREVKSSIVGFVCERSIIEQAREAAVEDGTNLSEFVDASLLAALEAIEKDPVLNARPTKPAGETMEISVRVLPKTKRRIERLVNRSRFNSTSQFARWSVMRELDARE